MSDTTMPLTPAQLIARWQALVEQIADARIDGTNRDKIVLMEAQEQALKARIDYSGRGNQ
jgi:hypothetical protein